MHWRNTILRVVLVGALIADAFPPQARAGITEQWFPLPAAKNRFLQDHYKYAQMLWAFDYGHALIYEQLWQNSLRGDYDFSIVEGPLPDPSQTIFARVMRILASPPRQSPAEESLSPSFTTDFSWLMNMFAWTHKLHWIAADVLTAESPERAKEILKQQLDEAYRRFPLLALPTKCKSMPVFMEGLPFSLRFRRQSPKANGLIWAYHYYQVAIYEALMNPPGPEREAMLEKVLSRFNYMAEDPAGRVPAMPMAMEVAPRFSMAYPELAATFDNLHQVHDVVGDILSINELLTLAVDDPNDRNQVVKLAVPESIKVRIPGDPKHVKVSYDEPGVKKAQMDRAMQIALDDTTFVTACQGHHHGHGGGPG